MIHKCSLFGPHSSLGVLNNAKRFVLLWGGVSLASVIAGLGLQSGNQKGDYMLAIY